ncbi:hypothetical protein [Archangium violaceum]|uniref:hypothetical protein n=1 Tax=Archangium violaceum TaxID=83451 RepID=UPI0036DE89D7
MRFAYTHATPDPGFVEAVAFANKLSFMEGFWQEIAEAEQFAYTTVTPAAIAERMRACTDVVNILHVKKRPITTAVTDPGMPFTIYVNTRRFHNRRVRDKVNTLVHEFVHNVDFFRDGAQSKRWNYTHWVEDHRDRPKTAPYWIGNLAERWWELANQHVPEDQRRAIVKAKGVPDFAGAEDLGCEIAHVPESEIER